jgi:succinate dehydrogenase / fumarate reductase cytochrome b subunit
MPEIKKQRPGTMGLFDALQYRLPAAGVVSILHRISGALMFVLLPLVIWMFDASVTSEVTYGAFTAAFTGTTGFVLKLVVLLLIWALLHHLIAGVRHLWMDVAHAVDLKFGRISAIVTLVLSLLLTLAFGVKLFF